MGQKSKQELQESQLLNKLEILACLPESLTSFKDNEINEFAFSLYQFTKLIYDNIK